MSIVTTTQVGWNLCSDNFLKIQNRKSNCQELYSFENILFWSKVHINIIFSFQGLLKWKGKHVVDEIMIQYGYPRLDINVTKGLNHLLKSPFCIHPKTGKVCCPFKPSSASKFDPTTVPTIRYILLWLLVLD